MSAVVMEVREPSGRYLAEAEPALVRGFELLATEADGVDKLRSLVINLAVRGRLLPEVGIAPAILSELQDQVADAIARLRGGRSSGVAGATDLPVALSEGWIAVRLGDIFQMEYGASMPEKLRRSGQVPVFGSNGVVGSHDTALVDAPSLVVGRKGSVGAVNVAREPFWPIDTSYYITPPPFVALEFAYLVFKQLDLGRHDKATAIPGINRNDVYAETIAIPPLAEQHRIVARVEELMKLCDALETTVRLADEQHARLTATLFGALVASESARALAENWQRVAEHFDLLLNRPEAIDALEQTILQLAVRGVLVRQDEDDEPASVMLDRIRRSKSEPATRSRTVRQPLQAATNVDEVPFEIPVGWSWARFSDLGAFGRGKSRHRPRNDPVLFSPGVYPLVQTGEVARAKGLIEDFHSLYSEAGLAQSKLWPRGTLCITIAANIADAAILGFDACFPDSVVGFIPHEELGGASYFLMFMETARGRLIEFAPATAQKNINLEVLEALRIPVPPATELRRIVARVEELRRLCAQLRERLTQARQSQTKLADALVAQAVGR